MSHKALRLAKLLKSISQQLTEFYKDYEDDSDSENNTYTNGYFPPRPSPEEIAWLEKRRSAFDYYSAQLIEEVLRNSK